MEPWIIPLVILCKNINQVDEESTLKTIFLEFE